MASADAAAAGYQRVSCCKGSPLGLATTEVPWGERRAECRRGVADANQLAWVSPLLTDCANPPFFSPSMSKQARLSYKMPL